MCDIILLVAVLAYMIGGYFVVGKIGDFIELDDEFAIFEVTTPVNWIGKTIGQIDIRKKFGINIMAIKQDGKLCLTIHPDTVLNEGETMLVLGEYKDIQKCFHI